MAPKKAATKKKKREACSDEPPGMFDGMVVFLVENGVQPRRLQIWKEKLMLMGATIEDHFSSMVTHIFAVDLKSLLKKVGKEKMTCFNGSVLPYQWLEDSLKSGQKVPAESYNLKAEIEGVNEPAKLLEFVQSGQLKSNQPDDKEVPHGKKARCSPDDSKVVHAINSENNRSARDETSNTTTSSDPSHADYKSSPDNLSSSNKDCSLLYSPPALNWNITEIFGKLIDVYRALGDDRRSFSYYKAIPVIEKLPFKIESVDQVKHLPNIGKGMQDHIHEIITTGKLSKLEHFETDEKVKTITLFGEVWGIGPTTALKLYEKGHRTLEDLKNDDSLTNAQKLGLKYFEDIKKRIPRNEVQDMELLLQKAAEDILPGVVVVCGGSFRRGKATCGDMDIIITHPDGQSHKGFLSRFVKYLKEINFLREDLVYSTHSEEGTDLGVDTYFGLCTYPGRETRHRIDLKVYPRSIYAFGLIAWTGNDVLNRRLRLLADSKGYRLDDTGLFLATTQGSGRKRGERSFTSLSFKTEKEVFNFLGFPWLEPNERNL